MNKAQKAGGGLRKIGRNKIKCKRYFDEDRRTKNKLKKFKKNNIGKDWTEDKVIKETLKFEDIQYKRQQEHK